MTTLDTAAEQDDTQEEVSSVQTEPAEPVQDDTPATPNREAAKYRRRLREAETERDTLAGRVETLQRREVERHAADRLAQPSDLFTVAGVALPELLDDAGDVDPGKVDEAVQTLLSDRPGLSRHVRTLDLGQGRRGDPTPTTSWGDVLRTR